MSLQTQNDSSATSNVQLNARQITRDHSRVACATPIKGLCMKLPTELSTLRKCTGTKGICEKKHICVDKN